MGLKDEEQMRHALDVVVRTLASPRLTDKVGESAVERLKGARNVLEWILGGTARKKVAENLDRLEGELAKRRLNDANEVQSQPVH